MKGLYNTLKGKKVEIIPVSFSGSYIAPYSGKVVDYAVHEDLYIILDTGEIVNIKYVRSIKIID